MINKVSFGSQVAGSNLSKKHIALSDNGNPYMKTNSWTKFGGSVGAIGTLVGLTAFGGNDKFFCYADRLAHKIFSKTPLYAKGSISGQIIGTIAVASGVVGLGSAVLSSLFGLIDKNKNKQRAEHADKMADLRVQRAVEKAMEKQVQAAEA